MVIGVMHGKLGEFSWRPVALIGRIRKIGFFDFEGPFSFSCEFGVYYVSFEILCLKPHLVSDDEWGEFQLDSVLHGELGEFIGGSSFISHFNQII